MRSKSWCYLTIRRTRAIGGWLSGYFFWGNGLATCSCLPFPWNGRGNFWFPFLDLVLLLDNKNLWLFNFVLPKDHKRSFLLSFTQVPQKLSLERLLRELPQTSPYMNDLWKSLLLHWKRGLGHFMFLLRLLFFCKNLFFFLLVRMSSCLDFSLLFLDDSLNLFDNNFGQFLLSSLLDVIFVHQRNWYVPFNVYFHCFEIGNTGVLLSGNESVFLDDGLLGVLIHSFEYVEDLVFPLELVDKGNIVDFIHSSKSLHVSLNVAVDSMWEAKKNLVIGWKSTNL